MLMDLHFSVNCAWVMLPTPVPHSFMPLGCTESADWCTVQPTPRAYINVFSTRTCLPCVLENGGYQNAYTARICASEDSMHNVDLINAWSSQIYWSHKQENNCFTVLCDQICLNACSNLHASRDLLCSLPAVYDYGTTWTVPVLNAVRNKINFFHFFQVQHETYFVRSG